MKRENNNQFNPGSFVAMTRTEIRDLAGSKLKLLQLPAILFIKKGWWMQNVTGLAWHELHSSLKKALLHSEN